VAKWTEYQQLAQWAGMRWWRRGWDGYGPDSQGDSPQLSYVPAAEEAATYFVRAAWLISDGEEGSPSDIAILIVPEGNTLVATR